MAAVINTTFKLKRGTASRWAEVNPILAQGEPGFVYDTNQLKIGDGVSAWNDLPYINDDLKNLVDIELETLQGNVEEINEKIDDIASSIRAIAEEVIPEIDSEIRSLIIEEKTRAELAEKELAEQIDKNRKSIEAIIENVDEEKLNSIKELASWIEEHGKDAVNMVSAIEKNASDISAIVDEKTGILALAKEYTDLKVATIPEATAESLGLVKFDNNTIKMNDEKQLYVNKVSTDALEMGSETLVLNGGDATK